MRHELKYGEGKVSFETPPRWSIRVIDHGHPEPRPFEERLTEAVVRPIGLAPLAEWLVYNDICVIVSDITRYTGAERFLPYLYANYLRGKKVEVLFGLGNHRKQTDEEKRRIVTDALFDAVPCIDHDCYNPAENITIGTLGSGLTMAINRRVLEKEAVIVTGSISFHYIAGFGGGRKGIFPGVSAYDTIIGVHKSVFLPDRPGKHPLVQSGILAGNPMHEAMTEGLALIKKPLFLVNTVVDDDGNILDVFGGEIKAAHEAGCKWYSDQFIVKVPQKADVAIVTAGGYPKDINFIQSHKALEHAKGGVKDGGTIILLARCGDGCGHDIFLQWFDYPTADEMEPHARESDSVYAQTAYSTRMKAENYRIVLVSDLDPSLVEKMGLTPARSVEEALALTERDKDLLCYIMPEGAKTLVQAYQEE